MNQKVVYENFSRFPVVERASGDCICDKCGKTYKEHPLCGRFLSYDGEPFVHYLCDGRRVKI